MYFEKISLRSEEEKELGMQLKCSEYQNDVWKQMRNCALASQTIRRQLTVENCPN
jgi:hypothetical protein